MKKLRKVNSRPGTLLYPVPSVMVSCGDEKENNIITVAWTGTVNSEPPIVYVSVRKSRYSHHMIAEQGEFVINMVGADLVKEMDYCGVKSGRDVDKFEKCGLTREKADIVKAPLIAEAPVCLECKVIEVKEFPTHDMFFGEVVAVHIAEDYINEDGAYDFGAMGLVTLNHGKYYKLEDRSRGFFGYSIMKPKTKARLKKQGRRKR